ncbi:HAD domain-containing protein [Belnapia moabensis]|uniref:HAD domain-containing protein n=1 Tax=Belnapia moabensis TaxID=365533 RepID=UPI0005BC3BCE|nr:HAD domain-containing protein [Belnapia moabensis]
MTPPVLFLDIDGVLLSGRAWLLPANQDLQARSAGLPRWQSLQLVGREAVFDPCAVALIGRICKATGAQVVVASFWRYTVGPELTRAKLLNQGLQGALLHEDWACPMVRHGSPDKNADISYWLEEHGVAHYDTWLVLDDENVLPGATLRTDGLDGLGVRDAAAAVRFFGSVDAKLGVGPLAEDDMKQVVQAFGGDRVEACRWLEGAGDRQPLRQRPSALFRQGAREEALRRLTLAAADHAKRKREQNQALNVLLGRDEVEQGEAS